MPTNQKVAIIHDWLVTYRGGERVLEQLLELYPHADIYTLFHRPGGLGNKIESRPIYTSALNKFPKIEKYYRYLLPLFPYFIERFDLSSYQLIISSSHCVAKGVIPPPDALHVSYCHTPMRYAWDRYNDYFGGKALEWLFYPFIHRLRQWDTSSSNRVDRFIANSNWVSKRIEKYYRRDAAVVYPPVETDYFQPIKGDRGDYYLVASAFAPYKRIDLAIHTCKKMKKKLLVVGTGQDMTKLNRLGGKYVKFLGSVSRESLKELYGGAKALLFPGEEDFGITPVEAMACGTPVIAFGRGGARESVLHQQTGILFGEQTVYSLSNAIEEFEAGNHKITVEKCRSRAEDFSTRHFLHQIQPYLREQSLPSETTTHLDV